MNHHASPKCLQATTRCRTASDYKPRKVLHEPGKFQKASKFQETGNIIANDAKAKVTLQKKT